MTVPHWPADLDLPLRSGWKAGAQDGRLPRAASAGPLGYRRRYSSVARLVGLELDLTRDQKAIFDNFHQDDAQQGSLPFTMPDPSTDGWALWQEKGVQLLSQTGAPILISARWLCLFGPEPPSETMYGNRFRIGFVVVVLP